MTLLDKENLMCQLRQLQSLDGDGLLRCGRVSRAVGLTIEAKGFYQPIGARCWVELSPNKHVEAEVVGFDQSGTYLMCIGHIQGIASGMLIIPAGRVAQVRVCDALLGRILNGAGEPVDEKEPVGGGEYYALTAKPINPLKRAIVKQPLDVGIRAINALLSAGQGQRLGLFAGSGVGKSVLLGMMTRYTAADVVVIGLIGERGREVREFIEHNLGEEGQKRAVVVAAPADESPLMRLHGAMVATSIAEYFRDQGKNVLLLMDSLTRFAQAQREIALSVGEPPATKGYPPSVFSRLPQLVERAGNGREGSGSITAFYTVLTEGDDQQDPIADAARAILDGHVVLSRKLAESGQFPAIDVEASISRVMPNIVSNEQLQATMVFKRFLSLYQRNEDMITLGAYQKGSDPNLDKAINFWPQMQGFIAQEMFEAVDFGQSQEALMALAAQLSEQS